MSKTADLYRLLQLPRSATVEQIKASFRRLAKELHPDTTAQADRAVAESRFKSVASAYQVLSNALTKDEYDRSIGNWPIRGGGHATAGGSVARPSTKGHHSSDNRIRSPATGATVSRDLYDVDAWNAHYYSAAPKRESTFSSPFVNYDRNEPESKHQRYYRRRNERERAAARGMSSSWNADSAYASFSDEHGAGDRRDRSSVPPRDSSGSSSGSEDRESSTATVDQQREQHCRAAADNLRQRRNERIRGGAGSSSSRSNCSLC